MMAIGKNDNGELVFLDPSENFNILFHNYVTYFQGTLYDEVPGDITRLNMHKTYEYFRNYTSDDRQKLEHANEIAAILEMLIRSIEWELNYN